MAYQIDRYNNTLLTSVEDGTIDQTTDLKFIGKNYAGYGEIQNENFLFLLESFSGANQPSRPLSGQVWHDSGSSKMKFYDGTQWRTMGGSEISATEPTGLAVGDFWWDTNNEQLYTKGASGFILIGPQTAGEGVTQMQSLSVQDSTNSARIVIAATIEDNIVSLISDSEFDINTTETAIRSQGYTRVKKGITLRNTGADGVTTSTDRYWGTASNADKLGGLSASSYLTTATPAFTSAIETPDEGILVGASQDLQFLVENGDEAVIQNVSGTSSILKIKTTDGAGTLTHVATFNSSGMMPAADNTFDIGSSTLAWRDIHAYSFVGEATKSTAMRVGTDFRTASVSASNNTVAVRDATGNIAANLFQGTATQARYADLAEKYTTAEKLPAGTAVAVCAHEDHEVAPASASDMCIGVVSTDPAYMMNSEADGQYIGLKGRLPVRVKGAVQKGNAVYAMDDGVSSTIKTSALVGVALETSSDEGEKLIECVLKV